jgi:hypothetical protein
VPYLKEEKIKDISEYDLIVRARHNCVVCNSPMERSFLPSGCEPIVSNRGERGFVKNFTIDHVEDEDDRR